MVAPWYVLPVVMWMAIVQFVFGQETRAQDVPMQRPFGSWPIQIDNSNLGSKLRQLELVPNGKSEVESAKKIYKGLVLLGTALSDWNPSFLDVKVDQALASRLRYLGGYDGLVEPMIRSINLSYSILPEVEANQYSSKVLTGLAQLNPDIVGQIKEFSSRELATPTTESIMAIDSMSFPEVRDYAKSKSWADLTGGPGQKFTRVYDVEPRLVQSEPYLPFSDNPYFSVANILLGPGSRFEDLTGFAAESTVSADSRKVASYDQNQNASAALGRLNNPITLKDQRQISPERQQAAKEASDCITKCMKEWAFDYLVLGGTLKIAERAKELSSLPSPDLKSAVRAGAPTLKSGANAVFISGLASGLALTGCTVISCKEELDALNKAAEAQKKVDQRIGAEAERQITACKNVSTKNCEDQKQTDIFRSVGASPECARMSSEKCENEKKRTETAGPRSQTKSETTTDPNKKKEGEESRESKEREERRAKVGTVEPTKKCRQDNEQERGGCGADDAPTRKLACKGNLAPECELLNYIKARDCDPITQPCLGVSKQELPGQIASGKLKVKTVPSSDSIDMNDREAQLKAAQSTLATTQERSLFQDPNRIASSVLDQDGAKALEKMLNDGSIDNSLSPASRNELIELLVRTNQ